MVDSLANTIYIFELKHHATAQQALIQIHDSGYMHKHLRSGKDIVLIGINFSSDGRNITDYLYEIYDTEGNKKHPIYIVDPEIFYIIWLSVINMLYLY
ncbi:PD-(D/E)XK nuclease domain-containing protein [Cardinium endosymbiont of Tipula unca]|uniref:PD-(D/E)XK nuclease domain-containing protein n=1 Tax=Cardinium endosymbiont of Tipula unca TaxID=3066216 RepID=UPI003BAF5C94